MRRNTALVPYFLVIALTGCSSSNAAPSMPPSSSFGNAPAPLAKVLLRMEDLPGTWALDDMAPDPQTAAIDPSAQEVNRCLDIPTTAQPNRDRTSYSMFFAQSPKVENSIIVNSSASLVAEPSQAIDNVQVMRSERAKSCLEPAVRQNAMRQYTAVGYDVRNAMVDVEPLFDLQKDTKTFALRSSITVLLSDGRTLSYYIDSLGVATNPVYGTLTVFRDGEPPPNDLTKKLLDTLESRVKKASEEH